MQDLLKDVLNLQILKLVCSGSGVQVNINYLSKSFGKHRKTVKDRVANLLSHGIIDRPVCPFFGLFRELPLLVTVYAELPNDRKIIEWMRKDSHIFGAFRIRQEEYNTLLLMFHKSVLDYQMWRESLVESGRIPERTGRQPSTASYFPTGAVIKYRPSAGIGLIENEFVRRKKTGKKTVIGGYALDSFALSTMKCLVNGEGLKINENWLAEELGVHRKTIANRLSALIKAGMILPPVCRFPGFFMPPGFLLVLSLVELKEPRQKAIARITNDPHISLAFRISQGRYNSLMFSAHPRIEEHLAWDQEQDFGAAKIIYLTSKMTVSIDQQKVSLAVIDERLNELEADGKT